MKPVPSMKKLPFLDLELLPAKLNQRAKGLIVLATGSILLLLSLAHYTIFLHKIDAIEQHRLNEADGNSHSQSRTAVSGAEIKVINDAIEQLSLPWGAFFTALEAMNYDDTHLLSIEPDPQKGVVKIVAEAPDVYGMLEYQRGLASQSQLKNVTLLQYETRADNPTQPTRFSLIADWGIVR